MACRDAARRTMRRLAPPSGRRHQHAAAALPGSAAACIDFVYVRGIVAVTLDLIVVGEFLARLYGANGANEHASVLDGAFAVGVARMVDKTRFVAVDAGIDHRPRIDREQKRM